MGQSETISHLDHLQQLYHQYELLVVRRFNEMITLLFAEEKQVAFDQIHEIVTYIATCDKHQQLLELNFEQIKTTVGASVAKELADLLQSEEFLTNLKRALHDPEFTLGFMAFLFESGFFPVEAEDLDSVRKTQDLVSLTQEKSAFMELAEVDTTYVLSHDTHMEQSAEYITLDVRNFLKSVFCQKVGLEVLSQHTRLPRGKTHVTIPEKKLVKEELLSTILLLFTMTPAFSKEYYLQHALKKLKLTDEKPTYPNFIEKLSTRSASEQRLDFTYEHKKLLQESVEKLVDRANRLLLKYTYKFDTDQEKVIFHIKNKLKFYVKLLLGKKVFQQGDLFNFYDSLVVAELLDAYIKKNGLSYVKVLLPKRIEDFGASVDIYLLDTENGKVFPIDITGVNRMRSDFEEKQIRSNNISFHEKTLIQFVDKSDLPFSSVEKVKVVSTIQNNTHDWLYRYMQCHLVAFFDIDKGSDVLDLGSDAYALMGQDDKDLADSFCCELLGTVKTQ